MNLKEVYLRLRKGQKVADVKDEFKAISDNYIKKKDLLENLEEGKITEEDFRKKFKPLLDIDDVLLSIEGKLIKQFPGNDILEMDIGLLKATIARQKKIMNYPAHVPLRVDQLRAAVTRQAYALIEEEEHKREELNRRTEQPLPEQAPAPKPAEPSKSSEETTIGWQYPADFFVDDAWGKPQAAFDLFKDMIWDVYRLRTQKQEEYILRGSIQAWANKHLIAPFPNIDAYIDTLKDIASKSKRHVRVLTDIILLLKDMPEPFELKEPSTKRVVFTERWDKIKKVIKKLPAEFQALAKLPADILSDFSEFLFEAKGEDVEPMIARPVDIPEGGSLRTAWSAPAEWFETDQTPLRKQKNAVNASYFLFLVSDSVVRLIDDLNAQPKIIEELAEKDIPDPGNLGTVLARIARDQKNNRKVWSLLAALSTSMWKEFKKTGVNPGFFSRRKLSKQRATLDRIWDLLPQDVHEFLQEPVAAIEDFFAQAGITKKAA